MGLSLVRKVQRDTLVSLASFQPYFLTDHMAVFKGVLQHVSSFNVTCVATGIVYIFFRLKIYSMAGQVRCHEVWDKQCVSVCLRFFFYFFFKHFWSSGRQACSIDNRKRQTVFSESGTCVNANESLFLMKSHTV